jgi:signal transduction histidine kinase
MDASPGRTRDHRIAQEQAALRRVAELVAGGPPPEEVFSAVAEEAGRLLEVDFATLVRYDPQDAITVAGTWTRTGAPPSMPVGSRLPLGGRNLTTLVYETGRPQRIDYGDVSGTIGDTAARDWGLRSSAGVPIRVEGRLWGAVLVAFTREESLPADAEGRLAGFTELVATAVANAQARTELRRFAEEQAALRRVATLVAGAASPEEVFAVVAEEVGRLLGTVQTNMLRYDPDDVATIVAAHGKVGDAAAVAVGDRYKLGGRNATTLVFETGRPARIDAYSGAWGAVGQAAGYRSSVGVPISVEGRLWGVIGVASTRDEPLPADIEARLAEFTELVATAVANAQARVDLRGFAEEQAALRRVATLVARGAPPEQVFAAVAEEIAQVLDAEVACILRYEADATGTVVATWGDARFWPVGSNWALEGVAARVSRTRRTARMDGYDQDPGEITAMARRIGARSRVGVPIIIDDQLWGAALVLNFGPDLLPAAAEERIASFADLVMTAMSNAHARSELIASRARVVHAADDTRRRLERDLHDGIQQRLVSLVLKARTIEMMTPQPADDIRGELSLLADGVGTALDELREVSHGIHPAILSEAGLGPALKALARRSAVPVELDLDLGTRLAERVEAAAYYIASEALTNVAKHARASLIDMHVHGCSGALTLSIRDDGIGGADPSRGSGIIGLKDRVEAVGGTISVLSPPGHGTALHVQLPADPAVPAMPGDTP